MRVMVETSCYECKAATVTGSSISFKTVDNMTICVEYSSNVTATKALKKLLADGWLYTEAQECVYHGGL